MFDRLDELAGEYAALERDLADPAVHADPDRARAVGRRYGELGPIVHAYREWQQVSADEATARELADEDASFAAEGEQLGRRRAELEDRLQQLLVPKDASDARDVILEVKAGEGGEESALFAGDLLRMYLRYAERHGWKTEILDSTVTGLGGTKDATVAIKAAGRGAPGDGAWSRLKYEGGVHRVQRVPVTESQGRIHTSAAGVLVMPEADPVEVTIDPGDLRVDVFRSSGPGGQSVNTTDSAVRITHLPTGIVVSCQNEKSQLQNKEQAMRILRARLLAQAQEEADAQAAAERRSQVAAVDRSQRVRTYNFPENRISDHRVGYKAYNLDQVIDGDLDAVIDALAAADRAEKIAEHGGQAGSTPRAASTATAGPAA
ncbi:MAG TPA: peptide chain release factor 1 [Streptosporangiaceae bacterium]|nr:peptide chain release factor 1 [Streptosporangiaceae bacterium]